LLHARWSVLLILCLLFFLTFGSTIQAESVLGNISLNIEKEIGYINYETITSSKVVIKPSPEEEQHLQTIFNRLVNESSQKGEINYSLTVVEDPSINAFSLPGGYVFVNTGLLDFVKNDDELAGVLAHEIAHVDRHHSMKSITRTIGMTAILTVVLNQGQNDSYRQELIGRMANVSLALVQLGFSRQDEYQADRYGVKFMREAGYNKQKLLNFWNRMASMPGGGKNSRFFEMFSTHPNTPDRIKKIEKM
jgi:beta-barrel assembly-enhancing protease